MFQVSQTQAQYTNSDTSSFRPSALSDVYGAPMEVHKTDQARISRDKRGIRAIKAEIRTAHRRGEVRKVAERTHALNEAEKRLARDEAIAREHAGMPKAPAHVVKSVEQAVAASLQDEAEPPDAPLEDAAEAASRPSFLPWAIGAAFVGTVLAGYSYTHRST